MPSKHWINGADDVPLPDSASTKPKILVVEDDQSLAFGLRLISKSKVTRFSLKMTGSRLQGCSMRHTRIWSSSTSCCLGLTESNCCRERAGGVPGQPAWPRLSEHPSLSS